MGNCFSDPSKKGGQKLGSAPAQSQSGGTGARPTQTAGNSGKTYEPPRTLGGVVNPGQAVESDADPRARAMMAAEERANAAKKKGVNTSNPKHGQLSAKLDQERKATSPKQDDERLMAPYISETPEAPKARKGLEVLEAT